jgi:2'-5' RNA ligase
VSVYIAVEFDPKTMQRLKQKQLIVKHNSKKGDFVQPETFHVTVLFCKGGNAGYKREDYVKAIDEMGKRYNPKSFQVQLENFGQFENGGDEGNVVWVGLKNSLPLYEIKKQLQETMQSLQVSIEKSQFPGYTPHVTMGYNVIINDNFDCKFEDEEPVTIKSIALWDSFKANDAYVYNKVHELFFN